MYNYHMKCIWKQISKRVLSLWSFIPSVFKTYFKKKVVFVSNSESARRQAMCKLCPRFSNGMCDVCGCVMLIKTKFASARCPLDGAMRRW
jgi:hypothetical protein